MNLHSPPSHEAGLDDLVQTLLCLFGRQGDACQYGMPEADLDEPSGGWIRDESPNAYAVGTG